MRARAERPEQPLTSGPSLSASEVVTVVRRLGFVALKAYEVMQGNLTSRGNYQLAEALADTLKPVVDMMLHYSLEELEDTVVDNEPV